MTVIKINKITIYVKEKHIISMIRNTLTVYNYINNHIIDFEKYDK